MALEIERRDGWAVHAVAHVMEMQGRIDEGARWLAERETDWSPDNGFAFHNWWHLALFHLDAQRYADGARRSTTALPSGAGAVGALAASTPPRCSGG